MNGKELLNALKTLSEEELLLPVVHDETSYSTGVQPNVDGIRIITAHIYAPNGNDTMSVEAISLGWRLYKTEVVHRETT